MELNRQSIKAFPKLWLVVFSGLFLFLTVVVHQTGFSAGGDSVQYLPVVQWPTGEYWNIRYKVEGGYYVPIDLQKFEDSTYLVAGSIRYSSGTTDGWVMKVADDGTTIWNKTIDQANSLENVQKALPTSDGGVVLVGSIRANGYSPDSGWIIKLNSSGSIAWQKRYDEQDQIQFHSATQLSNGDIVVSGQTWLSQPYTKVQALVVRLTSSGDIVWQHTYGGLHTWESAESVIPTNDGGLFVVGHAPQFFFDIWVMKLDGDGSVVWQKTYDSGGSDRAIAAVQRGDGSYLVAGWSQMPGGVIEGVVLLKLTADGSISWQRFIEVGWSPAVRSLDQTADNHYLIAGNSDSVNMNWVLKLDTDGNLIWSKGYFNNAHFVIPVTEVKEVASGQYLIAALTLDESNNRVMQLAKVNALGELPGCNDIVSLSVSVGNITFSPENITNTADDSFITAQNGAALTENSSPGIWRVCSQIE